MEFGERVGAARNEKKGSGMTELRKAFEKYWAWKVKRAKGRIGGHGGAEKLAAWAAVKALVKVRKG